MHIVDTVILVSWVIFWIYWLIAALDAKKGNSRSRRFAALRVAIVAIAIFLIRSRILGHPAVIDDPFLEGLGAGLFFLGLASAVWARVCLGRNWGTPMSSKEDPELVMSGPYRYVRHPIYSGIMLAMLGSALAISFFGLVVVAIVGAYFLYSATVEERTMTDRFPSVYPAYKHHTKMLIPFVF